MLDKAKFNSPWQMKSDSNPLILQIWTLYVFPNKSYIQYSIEVANLKVWTRLIFARTVTNAGLNNFLIWYTSMFDDTISFYCST